AGRGPRAALRRLGRGHDRRDVPRVPVGGAGLTRYDAIGLEYAATRREDPRIAALIHEALGPARTVVNVGAGTGSYEPHDRHVVPVAPRARMIAQRDPPGPPRSRGFAYPLPFEAAGLAALAALPLVPRLRDAIYRGMPDIRP